MTTLGNEPHGTGRCYLDEEMVAFDSLGPLSREAIASARFQIGAGSLVRALIAAGVTDLGDPAADRAGARCVRDLDCKLAYRFALESGTA